MRRNVKKGASLLMAAAMTASLLAGCGNSAKQAGNGDGQDSGSVALESTTAAAAKDTTASGAEGGADSQEPVTITVWRCNMTDERTALCESLNQKFMEEYPWITVEFTSLPDSFNEKLEVAFEAGNAPDVFFQNGNVIAYAKNGYIRPLDDLYEAWDYKDNMLESAIESIRNQDRAEHKLYFLPEGNNVNCLWVRSDWFSDAGLELPADWNNLLTDIETLTDTSAGRYGVALRGGAGSAANLEMMMYSYSGIREAFDAEGKSTLNAPENVEFVDKWLGQYGKMSAEGDIGNGWTELAAAFQSGKAAVIQHNTGSSSGHMTAFDGDMTKFEAIAFPESPYTKETVIPALGPSGPCISASCKNVAAAFLYAAYMVTGDAVSAVDEMWGQIPFDKKVLEYDWVQNTPWMKMGADLLLSDTTQFYEGTAFIAETGSIQSNEVEPMIQAVMAGQMTAQEMCDTWAGLMEEAYEGYK